MTPRGWIVAAAALAVVATGCSDSDSPADAVPALSGQLDRVDAAISAERYAAARSALGDLADETEQAQADGTLDAADAEAIMAAISTLEGRLPQPADKPSETPSATPSVTPPAEPDEEGPPEHAGPKPKPEKKPHPKPPKPHKGPKPGHGPGR